MGGTGVIDRFLEVFTRYIDSGFGLLGGEVAFIATTLIVIDITLAALFWSWGADEDIIACFGNSRTGFSVIRGQRFQ
jgi:type IV secretion system protein TrbL